MAVVGQEQKPPGAAGATAEEIVGRRLAERVFADSPAVASLEPAAVPALRDLLQRLVGAEPGPPGAEES
ncbi:MAG: hypothetical protein ACRD0D_06115 [Acidimicrobiales bacterium]